MERSPTTATSTGVQAERSDGKTVTVYQKCYRFLGFRKAYNFPLFIIFAGAMLGFTLARLSYLNISGNAPSSYASGAAPGEWYWFRTGHYRFGLTLHLTTILPAGLLMSFQFVPRIRYTFLIFHRINGYLIIILVFLSNIGALMIARRAFGGGLDTQSAVGTLVILTTTSLVLAWYNIKRLQIDQHRAWMLRAMFYLGTIITVRIIMIISALIITKIGSYNTTISCDEIAFIYRNSARPDGLAYYNECITANGTRNEMVSIHASFDNGRPEQIRASLAMSFGMAMWMSIFLHLVGVEIYLGLTPREGERLRNVSYERQMEKGFENAGSAGLTSDRWGDAEVWRPAQNSGEGEFVK